MTATFGTDRERADDEATNWLVRLSEDRTGDDGALRASFEAWRAASPLHAESWERARLAYDLIGQREPRHKEHWQPYAAARPAERSLPPARASSLPPTSARGRAALVTPWRLGAGFAMAACIALLMAVFLPGLFLRLQADVVTDTAELRSITLQEGSQVRLAPESAIGVAFVGGERRVRLLKGSAFFDVSPDEAHPFRVEAGDAVVTVLGTAFEVRLAEDGTLVAVQRGRVHVEDGRSGPAASRTLQAGDWARVTRQGDLLGGRLKPDDVAPWLRGKLVALDRPAGAVVDDLRPYYRGAIVVRSRAFADRRVSGIYDLNDPGKTLRDLASSHGARVHELSDWLLVITAAGE